MGTRGPKTNYLTEPERLRWKRWVNAVIRKAALSVKALSIDASSQNANEFVNERWLEKAMNKKPLSVEMARKVVAAVYGNPKTASAVNAIMEMENKEGRVPIASFPRDPSNGLPERWWAPAIPVMRVDQMIHLRNSAGKRTLRSVPLWTLSDPKGIREVAIAISVYLQNERIVGRTELKRRQVETALVRYLNKWGPDNASEYAQHLGDYLDQNVAPGKSLFDELLGRVQQEALSRGLQHDVSGGLFCHELVMRCFPRETPSA